MSKAKLSKIRFNILDTMQEGWHIGMVNNANIGKILSRATSLGSKVYSDVGICGGLKHLEPYEVACDSILGDIGYGKPILVISESVCHRSANLIKKDSNEKLHPLIATILKEGGGISKTQRLCSCQWHRITAGFGRNGLLHS